MANKQIFGRSRPTVQRHDTVNRAGGSAISASAEHQLCQFVVTSCFGNAYYSTAQEQLAQVKTICDSVSAETIAKAAVYGFEQARMKDVPAYLCVVLAARGELDLLRKVFPRVMRTSKMLMNFIQILRSGVTGRKSLGSAVKRLVQDWLNGKSGNAIFDATIGHSDPSLADVIKMVHPRPVDAEHQAAFAYAIGRDYDFGALPEKARDYLRFKLDPSGKVPNVDFRALTNLDLSVSDWRQVGRNMPWNALRLNLNTLARKGCFAGNGGSAFADDVAATLRDAELVRQFNAFPYQLMTTYQNITDVPLNVKNALQDAMEVAVENVPDVGCEVTVVVDLSASMNSPVTGRRGTATTVTTCSDVAGLIAASFLRNNKNSNVVGFGTSAARIDVNPYDSVMTNASVCGTNHGVGHGTDLGAALRLLNRETYKSNLVIVVTDMQTWGHSYYGTSAPNAEWANYKRRMKNAKMVYIDVQHYGTLQEANAPDVLNIGGFSDSIFGLVDRFVKFGGNGNQFVDIVNEVQL